MGIRECIDAANARGDITKSEADDLNGRYNSIIRDVRSDGLTRKLLREEMDAEAQDARRRARLTETARIEVEADILGYKNTRGIDDPGEAMIWMMEHKGQAQFQDVEHLRLAILGRAHAKLEDLLYEFRSGAVKGELRRTGGAVKARLENVVQELHGQASGDARAKELAQSWAEVTEALRQRFNAAGGSIRKLYGWGMPQAHDPQALLEIGQDRWVRMIFPLLDRERMQHSLTGRRLSDDELDQVLKTTWSRITTDGWIDREPSMSRQGKGALFRQHGDARFLHFRDGEAWLQYQKEFGEQDIFGAMMQHISVMTRDIAFMERLGPNPEAMVTYLSQVVEKQAAVRPSIKQIRNEQLAHIGELTDRMDVRGVERDRIVKQIDGKFRALDKLRGKIKQPGSQQKYDQLQKELFALQAKLGRMAEERPQFVANPDAQREFDDYMSRLVDDPGVIAGKDPQGHAQIKIKRAREMWDHMRGTANSPVSTKLANVMAGARNLVTSSILGSASLTALSDVAYGAMTRRFNGIPAINTFNDIVKQLVPSLKDGKLTLGARREAVRSSLILDSALHSMYAQARYMGTISGPRWTRYLADRTLTYSGLTPWTLGGKHAHGMAVQGRLADLKDLPFTELPEGIAAMLDRHGLGQKGWDAIRQADLYEPRPGGTFLRPNEVEVVAGRDLSEKYLSMILRQMTQATPEQSVRARTLLVSDQRPGTVQGEAVRTFAQLKAFPVEAAMLLTQNMGRELSLGNTARGAAYGGGLMLTGTILGALSLQLHELSNGRDPRPTDNAKFWGAAMLKGGGLGIFGDFFFSNLNKFGGGLAETIAGPMTQRATQGVNFTVGNAVELAQGKKTHAGREAVSILRQNTPVLSSLWWAKMAYQRVLLDQLQYLLDPEAHKSFSRRRKNQKRAYGNDYWWRPGEGGPRRAPDITDRRLRKF